MHYKGNIPKGSIPNPARRRSQNENYDSETSDNDEVVSNQNKLSRNLDDREPSFERVRNLPNKSRGDLKGSRRNNESLYVEDEYSNGRQNYAGKDRFRYRDQERLHNRNLDEDDEEERGHPFTKARSKIVTNTKKEPKRQSPIEAADDENFSDDDAKYDQQNLFSAKKSPRDRNSKLFSKSDWVTKTEYDALSNLCEALLKQQTDLQREVKQQARLIEVADDT